MGLSSRADPRGLNTVHTAPAALALSHRYDLAVGAGLGADKTRILHGAAVDSITSPITLGVVFHHTTTTVPTATEDLPGWREEGEDHSTSDLVRSHAVVGAALAPGAARFGVGVSGSWRRVGSSIQEPSTAWDMTASIAARPVDPLTLSLSGQDLLPNTSFRESEVGARLGAGLAYAPAEVLLLLADADYVVTIGQISAGGGLSARVHEAVELRGGYHLDGASDDPHHATAGLGLLSPSSSLDYGARIQVGGDSRRAWHSVALRFFF